MRKEKKLTRDARRLKMEASLNPKKNPAKMIKTAKDEVIIGKATWEKIVSNPLATIIKRSQTMVKARKAIIADTQPK